MAIAKNELEEVLLEHFPEADIVVKDLVGDNNHYSLEISDKQFAGLTLIAQHKLVKKALSELLSSKLHAITIVTKVKS
jgi:stress-induced morphogen